MTQLERLEWVIANVATVMVDGKVVPMNAGNWSLAAGLTRKALYTQMDRMRTKPDATLKGTTVTKLANAAGVSSSWLLDEEGPRIAARTVERDERYSVVKLVREAARNDGFDPDFVENFVAELDADDQPSFGEIWNLLVSAYARHERKTRAQGNPGADLDERPPPRAPQTTRKKR